MINLSIDKKAYGEHIIFEQTEIKIQEKDFIAIKGKSGCGKSTLLSMIGLLENFDGDYEFQSEKITEKTKEKIRVGHFSYVFQKAYLIPYITVKENILMPLKNLKESINMDKYSEVIELLDLKDLENRYPDNLSGGEAQRVAIARAVLSNRNILLCDEPTGSLDPINAKIVMDCLKEIHQKLNRTIFIVTHSSEFDSYFHKIYKIENQKVIPYEAS